MLPGPGNGTNRNPAGSAIDTAIKQIVRQLPGPEAGKRWAANAAGALLLVAGSKH